MTGFYLLRNDSGQTFHAACTLYNIDNKQYILTILLFSLVCFLIYFSPAVHYLFLSITGFNFFYPGKECSHHRLQKAEFRLHKRQLEDEFVFSHMFGVLRFTLKQLPFIMCNSAVHRSAWYFLYNNPTPPLQIRRRQ